MAAIAVLGTFDTKGEEHRYVADRIREQGQSVLLLDVGTLGPATLEAQVTREEVARAAGADLAAVVARRDRGEAVDMMTRGAPVVLARLQREGRINGVISLGGGGGTAICTAAMRALPVGFPKLMVSTLASGNTAPYVGVK
ncbi:MAG: Tm-1-like ATP-binding domain-containing protein, partial [Verrucomicrobiota bacterium]